MTNSAFVEEGNHWKKKKSYILSRGAVWAARSQLEKRSYFVCAYSDGDGLIYTSDQVPVVVFEIFSHLWHILDSSVEPPGATKQ